jgi:hypothetical protein
VDGPQRERHAVLPVDGPGSDVAALAEPLYDVAFALYFYSTHGMQTTFTVFNVPQPIWAYSGYAILYAAPAIYICRMIHQRRMTRAMPLKVAGVIFLMSCAFEIIGINMGTYTYWGPHVFRIFKYPSRRGAASVPRTRRGAGRSQRPSLDRWP